MTRIITNPDGTMQTAPDEDKQAATPESIRQYRRQLREKLGGGGWHKDDLTPPPQPAPSPAPVDGVWPFPVSMEDEA